MSDMETTAEDRARWTARADDAGRLARDFAELEAENGKLKATLPMAALGVAHARIADLEAANAICRRDIEALMTSCDKLEARNTEVEAAHETTAEAYHASLHRMAELEAERDQANSARWQAEVRMGAAEAERDRLKVALDVDDVLTELRPPKANANFRDGWVSGQRAFREAVRARAARAARADPSEE